MYLCICYIYIYVYLSIYIYIYTYIYIYIYIYIYRIYSFEVCLSGLVIFFTYGTTVIYIYIYIYIYISINYISYTLIVDNISFFHRLMSFEVQSCFYLNRKNRKEGWTQQEKKKFY